MSPTPKFGYEIYFLSYREPNADENYQDLVKKLRKFRFANVPPVNRVHGIRGIDSAHKHCATLAKEPFMLTIDGDCRVDPEFFVEVIPFLDPDKSSVLVFPAENIINGLQYGNGSLKLWPVDIVRNAGPMGLDYCCTLPRKKGHLINKCYSFTDVNGAPDQAWMAGFREGVKLSVMNGKAEPDLKLAPEDNLRRLRVWCCVGADKQYGHWAMLGARQGMLYSLSVDGAGRQLVNDFDWLLKHFQTQKLDSNAHVCALLDETAEELQERFAFEVTTFNPKKSRIFKLAYSNPRYIAVDESWVTVTKPSTL